MLTLLVPGSKIPDVLVTAKRPTAQKPAALPAIPSIIVAPKYTEDEADDQEDLFAELDTAAEIARVVAQQPPPQKKARVEEVRIMARYSASWCSLRLFCSRVHRSGDVSLMYTSLLPKTTCHRPTPRMRSMLIWTRSTPR